MKHVISVETKQDNLKGTCTGEGRIKVRLNEGETTQTIRDNLSKHGLMAAVHKEDPRKKPDLTGPKKDKGDHRYYGPKDKKAHEMATKY